MKQRFTENRNPSQIIKFVKGQENFITVLIYIILSIKFCKIAIGMNIFINYCQQSSLQKEEMNPTKEKSYRTHH